MRRPWLVWLLMVFGSTWIACHLVDGYFTSVRMRERFAQKQPELYGIWRVERLVLDGTEVPATDASRWRFVAIDKGPRVWMRESSGRMHSFACTEQLAENRLVLKARGNEDTWSIERGTKLVPELDPEPLRAADRQKPVDVERRTLVCKGTWSGKQVEVQLVEKGFPVHTPFRLRQELPDRW